MASIETSAADRKLAAIVFADIEGYSRIVDHDEAHGIERVNRTIRLFKTLIPDYGGSVVNVAGDGILSLFDSATKAVKFASEFQREVRHEAVWTRGADPIAFRIGINLGEAVRTAEGAHGHAINVAQRLQAIAEPGGICVSGMVREAVHDWSNLALKRLGPKHFKNIADPVEVFAIELANLGAEGHAVAVDRPLLVPAAEHVTQASVAVLPFANLTGEPTDDHFCVGLADDIISGLCRFRDLLVIAPHSVQQFRHRETSLEEVGRKLGVRYVLDSNLQRFGRSLRIRVRLEEARSGHSIWSERYDGALDDVFAFQDDITERITAVLAIQIHAAERRRAMAEAHPDIMAYGLVLRGHDLALRFRKEANAHARRLFEHAAEVDPAYGRAYAAISRTFNLAWRYAWTDSPRSALDRAVELATAAIDHDDLDARGYGELGYAYLYRKQHDESLASYERALQLNPNDADLLAEMGDCLVYTRQAQRAVELLQRAIRLNPYHPDWYLWYLGDAYFHLGDYRQTIDTLHRMRDVSEGHRLLASSHALLGETEQARRHARLLLEKHPNFSIEHWRTVPPNKYPDDLEIFIDGLRKAGLK